MDQPFLSLFAPPMQAGISDIQPQAAPPQPVTPTPQDPFPGSGVTISQGAPDPAMEAQMDREEAAGAGNLGRVWEEHARLRRDADEAMRLFQAGQLSPGEAAARIERYNKHRADNRQFLELRPVNRGNPIWNFIFGGQ